MTLKSNENADEIVVFFDENVPRDALADEGVGNEFVQLCRRAASADKILRVDFSDMRFLSSGMVALLVRAEVVQGRSFGPSLVKSRPTGATSISNDAP